MTRATGRDQSASSVFMFWDSRSFRLALPNPATLRRSGRRESHFPASRCGLFTRGARSSAGHNAFVWREHQGQRPGERRGEFGNGCICHRMSLKDLHYGSNTTRTARDSGPRDPVTTSRTQ